MNHFKMRFFWLISVFIVSACADTVLLNDIFDHLLESARGLILKSGMDTLKIPDMTQEWKAQWHLIKVSGHLKCKNGWVSSLASLKRTGDVTMKFDGSNATLTVQIGLGHLEFGFGTCLAKARHIGSTTSKVNARVESNSVELRVSLTGIGAQCVVSLDHIVLNHLGKIKISTGGGVFHKIENKILNWASNHFHNKVVKSINDKLTDVVTQFIPKLNLCANIPL